MRAALLILAKDLRLRSRDRSVFLFALVVPLGLTFLFSAMLPDTEDLHVRGGVVDEDGGSLAASFVDEVLPAVARTGILDVEVVDDVGAAERALRDGDLDAVWVVPPVFTASVTSGRPAEVRVLVSPEAALAGEIARGVATSWVSRLETTALAVATVQRVADGQVDVDAVAAEVAGRSSSIELEPLLEPDQQLDTSSYLAAGMAAFFVFFTVQFGVTGLLEERTQGTLPRLLAAPVAAWSVQVGKALGAALLGLVSMAVLAVASSLLLGADWGPPTGVVLLIVALVAAAVGLMALVGSFARTSEQAGNYQSIVAVVLGMLGGAFIPLPATSGALQLAASASPHGWFLRGVAAQAATGRWVDVLPAVGAITLFGLAAALPAVWRLRRAATW